jgi:hypothetical protein
MGVNMSKNYLNRSNAEYDPIGDPLGGDPRFSRIRRFNDPVTAVIAGGASLLGSAMSGSAAKSAAQTQADAATRAAELQQQTAMAGIPILQQAYGQGQNYVNQGYGQGTGALNQYYGQGTQAVLGQEQPQQNYLNNLLNQQQGTQGNIYAANTAPLAPYLSAGGAAASQLQDLIPSLSRSFTAQDLNSYLAPNYQFMLNQGLGATNQALNVAGGGSNMVNAANIFAQNYAGNAYQNAFNNYQTQQNNIYNRLAGIAGLGQTAAGQNITAGGQYGGNLTSTYGSLIPSTTSLATATGTNLAGLAQNTGTNLANLAGTYGQQSAGLATGLGANTVGLTTGAAQAGAGGITGAANAQAAGQIGAGNAVAGGLTNAGNNYLLSQLLAPNRPTSAYGGDVTQLPSYGFGGGAPA